MTRWPLSSLALWLLLFLAALAFWPSFDPDPPVKCKIPSCPPHTTRPEETEFFYG